VATARALADAKLAEEQHAQTLATQLAALQLPEDAATLAAARGATEAELARLQTRLQGATLAAELETELHGWRRCATRSQRDAHGDAGRRRAGLVGVVAQRRRILSILISNRSHATVSVRSAATAATEELDEGRARHGNGAARRDHAA
jgi:hypothetical protein